MYKVNPIDSQKGEFYYCFKITDKVVFQVKNYTIGSNKENYFATEACLFNNDKTDYNECGQCQERLLPKDSLAYKFYKKWDYKQTLHLSDTELQNVKEDVEKLKQAYPYVESMTTDLSFGKVKQLVK